MKNMNTSWIVFKGGTAFNDLLKEFHQQFPHSTYVVPITDDGGSSREIRRVFGGPSIGDLRSTLTRLSDESTAEACAIKKLLEYRLPVNKTSRVQEEWTNLLEGQHPLYQSISEINKEKIRHFLCQFERERLQRLTLHFDFHQGSIGNFFFSGARMALGSLDAAIDIYSNITHMPTTTHVLPIIDSNNDLEIGAQLENGAIILGQQMISHPDVYGRVNKNINIPLSTPIAKLFYIDRDKKMTYPQANPRVIEQIKESQGILYGIGSLWTSIIPSLILQGMGEAISSLNCPKVLLLNSCHDRETTGLSALDYLICLTKSLNRYGEISHPPRSYITHLFVVEGCTIHLEEEGIKNLGIHICRIPFDLHLKLLINNQCYPVYSQKKLIQALLQIAS